MGSVTVTLTSTRSTSTLMGLVWVLSEGSISDPAGCLGVAGCAGAVRGVTCTSSSVLWPSALGGSPAITSKMRSSHAGKRHPPRRPMSVEAATGRGEFALGTMLQPGMSDLPCKGGGLNSKLKRFERLFSVMLPQQARAQTLLNFAFLFLHSSETPAHSLR